jgi:hypothetical protein
VTAHEVVIRFGRPFDIRIRGEFRDTTEVTIPFADQESAEAALREVTLSVRAVHDAGGEEYRPVVAGEVVETEAEFAADLARAVGAQRERERSRAAIPPPKPDRDMNDLRDWGANDGA